MKKNSKGITLVALVITIIILLILAGITIISLSGDNGLFTRSQQAKNKTLEEQEKEQIAMNGYQEEIEKQLNNTNTPPTDIDTDDTESDPVTSTGEWNDTKKVNSPELMEGMTGVYWDDSGNEIKVTNSNIYNWYNYDQQKWANAKTKDGSYWVWIPRYAYQIESGCYTRTAGKISIKFLQGKTNKDSDGNEISTQYPSVLNGKMSNFVVHPSFTNGKTNYYRNGEWDSEITGYWVAKYIAGFQECTQTIESDGTISEPVIDTNNIKYSDKNYTKAPGSTNKLNAISQTLDKLPLMSYPVFKPLTYVYNCITIGDIYTLSQEIAQASNFYGLNSTKTDSHQMKNSEWGAVAYLTQSEYGRDGEEITINSKKLSDPDSKHLLGVSGYANSNANDVSASTTNNKSGIFDLSGCAFEYTSAYISNGDSNIKYYGSSFANINASTTGYRTLSTKYATVYPYDSNKTGAAYNNVKSTTYGFGDAILETSFRNYGPYSWYQDDSYFPYLTTPFFVRGGSLAYSYRSGAFAFDYDLGSSDSAKSFRTVLTSL